MHYWDGQGDGTRPGFDKSRETTVISMQNGRTRGRDRVRFRTMATSMAARYLTQMPVFNRRRLHRFSDLLATEPASIAAGKRSQLEQTMDRVRRRCGVTQERDREFVGMVRKYLRDKLDKGEDLQLAMLSVLYERYAKRTRGGSLFPGVTDPDPARPLGVDAAVAEGAKIHLLHKFGRPYFFRGRYALRCKLGEC